MKKKKSIRILISVLVIIGVVGVYGVYQYGPLFNFYLVPPSVDKYVKSALQRMDQGLYAEGKEWTTMKTQILEEAKKANSYEDTYPYLKKAIQTAGGKHSFINVPQYESSEITSSFTMPTTSVENDILLIQIPPFLSSEKEDAQAYAQLINEEIHSQPYQGIIIDLADNTGGDMGPMIAGISSLLPDGELIHYQFQLKNEQEVTLEKGATEGGGTPVQVENTSKITGLPIAIILNNQTASAGEITALAFKGLEDIRFFGTSSAGYTTANASLPLFDGAILQLTVARLRDRTGVVYENNPLIPDVETSHPLEDATTWIQNY